MQIDSYVGELLDTIDDLGIAENTVVVFTADNGPESLGTGETSLTVETAVHGSAGAMALEPLHGIRGGSACTVCHSLAREDQGRARERRDSA